MIAVETFRFLKDLASNNERGWFLEHKGEYMAARENAIELTGAIIEGLSKIDSGIPASLDPSNCVLRIYRDIRFSKDKTPYKTNFGVAISDRGKNFYGPGYYLHIEPGKSFMAGGCWEPEANFLKAIRQEIDYNGGEFLEILKNGDFKRLFGDLERISSLKTAPKGYDASHELIEYLKLKSFVATRALPDEALQDPAAVDSILYAFEKLLPLMVFLRSAIS